MIARTLRPRDRRSRNGPIVFEHACKLGLEGIVFQRRDSGYRSGRSPHWIKSKNPACVAML
jgi:bifunctional non-homologous end joining protein LigD